MVWETGVQPQVESYQRLKKWYLFNAQHYKVQIKDKWSNPTKGVVPFPTPSCSGYWKGAFQSPLTMIGQLYLLIGVVINSLNFLIKTKSNLS